MVQALLNGRKTQTRRIVNYEIQGPNKPVETFDWYKNGEWVGAHGYPGKFKDTSAAELCPYGQPGDYLWVRENWRPEQDKTGCACINYQADDFWRPIENTQQASERWIMLRRPHEQYPEMKPAVWRPSIHMPRWASRLTLKITDVRVERIQDISEDDAKAEGAQYFKNIPIGISFTNSYRWSMENPRDTDQCLVSARYAFANFFCKTGKTGKLNFDMWDSNPWVWVIEFEVIHKNISELMP